MFYNTSLFSFFVFFCFFLGEIAKQAHMTVKEEIYRTQSFQFMYFLLSFEVRNILLRIFLFVLFLDYFYVFIKV